MSGLYESATQRMLREVRDRDRLLKHVGITKNLLAQRSSVAEIQEALRVTKVLHEPGVSEAMRLARLTTDATRALAATDFSTAAAAHAVTASSSARTKTLADATAQISNMTASTLAAARTLPPIIDSSATASAITAKLSAAMDATSAILPATPRMRPVPMTASGPRAKRVDGAASIGPLIRKARKAMKLSQAEFAAHAGVGRRFLSELEGGKPSLEFDKVVACAQAAGIDLFARLRHG